MSRAQQSAIESTETGNSATSTAAANASEAEQQGDINQNESQLAKFAANNPYVQGGAFQTAENKELSNTADATAAAAKAQAQQQAQRTGQNAAAPIAAGEAEQQAAQRTLAGEEGAATANQLASGAGYGKDVLSGGQAIEGEQAGLTNTETGEAQGQENTAEQAAQTPSFLDELGQGLITGGSQIGAAAVGKYCWIAARLYGGWYEPRTVIFRVWLFDDFGKRWYGMPLVLLYSLVGQWVADVLMPRSKLVSRLLQRLFDAGLKQAEEWGRRN